MFQPNKIIKNLSFIFVVVIFSLSLVYAVSAWTEPIFTPPDGNTAIPLNTSSSSQTKQGALSVTTLYDANSPAYFVDPSAPLSAKLNGSIDLTGNRITNVGAPTSSSDVATKEYVDALGGGSGGGGSSFIPAGTYFLYGVGGSGDTAGQNVYYCLQKVVSGTGQIANSSINQNLACDLSDLSKKCYNGTCVTVTGLTYSGATHVEPDCIAMGGTVYDSDSGTFCKFTSNSCPSGWTQAGSWQKYSVSVWGGDACGRFKSDAPTVFSDITAHERVRGSYTGGATLTCDYATDSWHISPSGDSLFYVATNTNSPTNRQEIGCK